MEFAEIMARRWSCRAFLPDSVPDEVLTTIFATAQRTPSWCNTQSWGVHLISGQALAWFAHELSAKVAADPTATSSDFALPAQYVGRYQARRREAGYALYASMGIERTDHAARHDAAMRNYRFFGAPHLAIITSDADHGVYGAVDCGGFVATVMNAALDLGVATVAQGAIGMQAGVVRQLLALPSDRLVVCGVALGYPDEADPVNTFRTARSELTDLVTEVEAPTAVVP